MSEECTPLVGNELGSVRTDHIAPQNTVPTMSTQEESKNEINEVPRREVAEPQHVIEYYDVDEEAAAVLSIIKPVLLTMILVVFVVRTLYQGRMLTASAYSSVLVYEETESDSSGTKLLGAVENALVIIGAILVATIVMVLLYKYRCMKFIFGYLIFACTMLLALFGGFVALSLLQIGNIPTDYPSFVFFIFNFAIVGVISIFWHAPARVTQGYLVMISVLMATSLTQLPEWTTWMLLCVVAIYDLIVVLWKRGPLRVLVETAQDRNEAIPGLIYSAFIHLAGVLGPTGAFSWVTIPQFMGGGGGKGGGFKLGLGDFVFYSVLCGRAAMGDSPYLISAACIVAILTGLCTTLFILIILQKALPALPISIFMGTIVYFVSRFAMVPFVHDTVREGVFM